MAIVDIDQAPQRPSPPRSQRRILFIVAGAVLVAAAVAVYVLTRPDLAGRIVIPYIAHQMPVVDPHLPHATALSDKLDEVLFDGLFNVSANPSGIVYENGLGELIAVDAQNTVTVRLDPNAVWHDSYNVWIDGEDITTAAEKSGAAHLFTAADIAFTLERIQRLGSLSPDYILVSQALDPMAFDGPNENGEIRFKLKSGRIWKESDIKEVLSFKILPAGADVNASQYTVGTGPYVSVPSDDGTLRFRAPLENPVGVPAIDLGPFIDNSTFTTEFRTGAINVVLETPFGSISPLLTPEDGFVKSNTSTTFFAVLFNTQRLDRAQREQLRLLLDSKTILDRFFRVNSAQQRNIIDHKGTANNFDDLLNSSVFPSSSYYIEEEVIEPVRPSPAPDPGVLPDTVRIKACLNFGFREEYADLIEILNDPAVTRGRIRATAVSNEELRTGNYDAVLVAFSGYRSNFLFDLYSIFLREPDLETYRINLITEPGPGGTLMVGTGSLRAERNFFRLDAVNSGEAEDIRTFLDHVYAFMSARHVGDKQEYARRLHTLEQGMALGAWLFSLPSLAYFGNQFDPETVNLYGVASQLSTIEQWKERTQP